MEERLRKFAHLVDAGSFTAASRDLHISQPALSTAIKKLERELHAELLVRGSHTLLLTDAGKLAYDSAKELGVLSGNLITTVAELTRRQPEVAIGMIDSVAGALFASADNLGEIEERAKVSIVVNNSRYLPPAVERNELDMAFITDVPPRHLKSLEVKPITIEPFVLACHAADAGAARQAARAGRLPRFISYDEASATRKLIDEALARHNIKTEPNFSSTSPEVMLRLVLLRKGVAALPYLIAKEFIASGELALLGDPRPIIIERPISVIIRRGKVVIEPLKVIERQVARLLDTYYKEALGLR
jgi:DNA-binding transcriptional LysR family regulator